MQDAMQPQMLQNPDRRRQDRTGCAGPGAEAKPQGWDPKEVRFAALDQANEPHDGAVRGGERGSSTELISVHSRNKMIDPPNLSREPTLVGLALPLQSLET